MLGISHLDDDSDQYDMIVGHQSGQSDECDKHACVQDTIDDEHDGGLGRSEVEVVSRYHRNESVETKQCVGADETKQ